MANQTLKIKTLLESREKYETRLKRIQERFKDEKENEEAWPGHAGTSLQQLEADRDIILESISSIDKELKDLGYRVN